MLGSIGRRPSLPPGTVLDGSYRIKEVIGAGGFGITYLAQDYRLATTVAIKEYFPEQFGYRSADQSVGPSTEGELKTFEWGRDSFLQEAQTLARFRHSSIVQVTRVFEANSTAYMVMAFEHGKNLENWLDELGRAPTQDELDAIARPVLDGLEVMHAQSFLHRDIAPDNIIVRTDGTPVLLDFGSARRAVAEHTKTFAGLVKTGYSPQEQYVADGRLQGTWSDFYAFGATFYRAVTGNTPDEATRRSIEDHVAPAVVAARGAYRASFLRAIDACLRMKPSERPQSVAQLRELMFEGQSISSSRPATANQVAGAAMPNKSELPSADAGAPTGSAADVSSKSPPPNADGSSLGLLTRILVALIALAIVSYGGFQYLEWQNANRKRVELEARLKAGEMQITKERQAAADKAARQRQLLSEAEREWQLLKNSTDNERLRVFAGRYGETPYAAMALKLIDENTKREFETTVADRLAKTEFERRNARLRLAALRWADIERLTDRDTQSKQLIDFLAEFGEFRLYADMARAKLAQIEQGRPPAAPKGGPETASSPPPFRDCPACPELVTVPAGEFAMGSSEEKDERPVRRVTVRSPFAVSRFEITFAEWDACVEAGACKNSPDDNKWGRGKQPVINVSWDEITKEYIPWLSRTTGKKYRLPTEAEWEYAARGTTGRSSRFSWGDDIGVNKANCDGCGSRWDNQMPAPVGSFAANSFGLHDMHGNVREWVQDCYKESYENAPSDERAVVETPACQRVIRGGSFVNYPMRLRSAFRGRNRPDLRSGGIGFRVARQP